MFCPPAPNRAAVIVGDSGSYDERSDEGRPDDTETDSKLVLAPGVGVSNGPPLALVTFPGVATLARLTLAADRSKLWKLGRPALGFAPLGLATPSCATPSPNNGLRGGVRNALIVDESESAFGMCLRDFLGAGVEVEVGLGTAKKKTSN